MHPRNGELIAPEDLDAATFIPQELQVAIRLSFEAVTEEPLPREMALLLLRLALAEFLRGANRPEAEEDSTPSRDEQVLVPEWT